VHVSWQSFSRPMAQKPGFYEGELQQALVIPHAVSAADYGHEMVRLRLSIIIPQFPPLQA